MEYIIDFEDQVIKKNLGLLIDGFWYSDLPPIFNIESIKTQLEELIIKISNNDFANDFQKNNDGIIQQFKSVTSPDYIFNDGIEPILFFEFKKNGDLREMQIPNLRYYCSFIFNTLMLYPVLFNYMYSDDSFKKYVFNSNSYILYEGEFYTDRDYTDEEESFESGIFAVDNNKTTSQLAYENNNVRYYNMQGSKIYTLKMDVESFYANVYTHYLARIKGFEPFKNHSEWADYFEFLDYYNMKINNNQTKGIAPGPFSSVVASELLMLCVDYEVRKYLSENDSYIRYVDDMVFFSDSLENLQMLIPKVQKVLNRFRLRINNTKTEVVSSIDDTSFLDINQIKQALPFIEADVENPIAIDKYIFHQIKKYISQCLSNGNKAEVKATLTMLRKAIHEKRIVFTEDSIMHYELNMVAYMLQIACTQPITSSRCYLLIEEIISLFKENQDVKKQIMQLLIEKNLYINTKYNDTVLQIWHYYVLANNQDGFTLQDIEHYFDNEDINPVILSAFIKKGEGKNRDIVTYIKKRFLLATGIEDNRWKNQIMFSKWWLPLFLINLKDGKNYESFFKGNSYPTFYKMMKPENSITNE